MNGPVSKTPSFHKCKHLRSLDTSSALSFEVLMVATLLANQPTTTSKTQIHTAGTAQKYEHIGNLRQRGLSGEKSKQQADGERQRIITIAHLGHLSAL